MICKCRWKLAVALEHGDLLAAAITTRAMSSLFGLKGRSARAHESPQAAELILPKDADEMAIMCFCVALKISLAATRALSILYGMVRMDTTMDLSTRDPTENMVVGSEDI